MSRLRPPLVTLSAAITDCLVALICIGVVALPGHAASSNCEASSGASSLAVLPSIQSTSSPFIVMGFLGGFVPNGEPHHPEVQVIRDIRQEYPEHGYFCLYENSKVDEAYRTILAELGAGDNGTLSDHEKRRARILLFGHSWGASAVVALSRKLEQEGIPVLLTVQVDSVAKPFQNDRLIPPNVLAAANFYQTRGLVHGQSRITAADPTRTTILGNFRLEYTEEPKECRDFSWHARFFTKSDIEIECDPRVWSQVKELLRSSLPNPVAAQTEAVEPDLGASRKESDVARQR